MGDKIANPKLIKPITVTEYARHNTTGVPVKDTNKDGKVTEADKNVDPAVLVEVCREKGPDEARMVRTDGAKKVLDRNNVSHFTHTRYGKKSDMLYFHNLGGSKTYAYGMYDASVGACHYNKTDENGTAVKVDKGRNADEVSFTYEDAKGKHKEFWNLVTGAVKEAMKGPAKAK